MEALPNSGPMSGGYGQPVSALPILTLDGGDVGDFDYSAFLDEQDFNYLAESSESMTTPPTASSPSLGALSDAPRQMLAPQQQFLAPSTALIARSPGSVAGRNTSPEGQAQRRQRLERRGHTKSRRGCFNCKRRRIKCQETKPACGHCVKQGLKCEYPSLPSIVHQPQHQTPLFSLQDMRFFQHFLLECYPHHPIGSEDIWTHEIPCLSEKYEYLMHAILGYSASALMVTSDASLAEAAMMHRLKAIKAIKKALSPPPTTPTGSSSGSGSNSGSCNVLTAARTPCSNLPTSASPSSLRPGSPTPCPPKAPDTIYEEGNALMATCFALTYQSVLLPDGMAEYMTFIRGIMIVAVQMYCKGATLLFGHLLGERQTEVVRPYMEGLGLVEREWRERAVEGVEGLGGLVEGREVEGRYWEMIGGMARGLGVSSWEAYVALTEHYAWWMMLPHDKFQPLVDPGNQVAALLAAHWIALEQIMCVICEAEQKGAAKTNKSSSGAGAGSGNLAWLRHLNAQVDAEHRRYNGFPMWVEAQMVRDRTFFRKPL